MFFGLILTLGGSFAFAQLYYAQPLVQTGNAANIAQNSATLTGTINPNGYPTNYYFEYGPTLSFGQTTGTQSVGSGSNTISVSAQIYSLNSNTLYYYRLVAQGLTGNAVGQILSFTTGNYAGSGTAPSVDTNAAANVSNNSATLLGYVRSNGSNNSYGWFEYGTSPNYLTSTTPQTYVAATSYSQYNSSIFSAQIYNLTPGTIYYFRSALRNDGGVAYGQILSFTTTGGSYPSGSSTYYPSGSSYGYYGYSPYTSYAYYNPNSSGAPSVNTLAVSNIANTSATLNGQVNLGTTGGSAWFEYGPSTSLGYRSDSQSFSFLGGSNQFNSLITNLNSGTTYYYRAVISSLNGTMYGQTMSFQTGGANIISSPSAVYNPSPVISNPSVYTYTPPVYTYTYTPSTVYGTPAVRQVSYVKRTTVKYDSSHYRTTAVGNYIPSQPTNTSEGTLAYGQGVTPGQLFYPGNLPSNNSNSYAVAGSDDAKNTQTAYVASGSSGQNSTSSSKSSGNQLQTASIGFLSNSTLGFTLLGVLLLVILWVIFKKN